MKHRNSSYLRNSSLTLGCLDVKSAWGSGKKYFIAFQSFLTSPTLHPNFEVLIKTSRHSSLLGMLDWVIIQSAVVPTWARLEKRDQTPQGLWEFGKGGFDCQYQLQSSTTEHNPETIVAWFNLAETKAASAAFAVVQVSSKLSREGMSLATQQPPVTEDMEPLPCLYTVTCHLPASCVAPAIGTMLSSPAASYSLNTWG